MRVFYGLLVWFLRIVLGVFFRTTEVVGHEHIPSAGPVIFVGNHPNSLLDPVLITISCGRKLHFLAKDTLFKWPPLRLLLNTLGAVPVRRRQDHPDGALDNKGPFEALFQLLREGGACGIFPEGISHASSELAPLKTGAARIAFGSASELSGREVVRIVPCGLTYFRRTRMRSRVLVQFGEPIEIDPERLEAWKQDERLAVRALTSDIEAALRSLTINAPDFETLRVLDMVRRLYASRADRALPLAHRAELTRRFTEGYLRLRESEPDVAEIYKEASRYVEDTTALGLSDHDVGEPVRTANIALRVARHLFLLLVLAPLTAPGVVLHAPLLMMAVVAGDGLTRRRDVVATTKVMVTTLGVPLVYGLIVALLVWQLPYPSGWIAGGAAAVLLPLSGWATMRVFRRQAVLRRSLWVLLNLVALRREVDTLRAQRGRLVDMIWAAVDRHIDPGLERIIPPEGEGAA